MPCRPIRLVGAALLAVVLAMPAAAQTTARPLNHDRSNIPPRATPNPPGLNHDRSNFPPRANPNPPGLNHDRSNGHANPGRGGPAAVVVASRATVAGAVESAVRGRFPAAANAAATGSAFARLVDRGDPGTARSLAAELAAGNDGARREAAELARTMDGLLAAPERLPEAVAAFNRLVEASAPGYLADPPVAFVAAHAALAALSGEAAPRAAAAVAAE